MPVEPAHDGTPQTPDKYICFRVADQEFGLAITGVQETIPGRPMTRVPLVPECVAGLINLRGDVIAVLDLARLLDLGGAPGREVARIVLLRGAESGRGAAAGLLVEELHASQRLPAAALRPPPPALPGGIVPYLRGVAWLRDDGPPRLLLVLDPQAVLNAEPLRPFRRPS